MEQFKTINPGRKRAHLNYDYWQIVDACWKTIIDRLPKNYSSLKPIIDSIESREFIHSFDSIYGDVQRGKSTAMMMLIWYCIFMETDVVPCVLTLKNNNARQDFLGKMSIHGTINKLVHQTIITSFPTFTHTIPLFQLQGIGGDNLEPIRQAIKVGLAHNEVPVLLQEPFNIQELFNLYHKISKDRHQSLLLFIDEYHQMYTQDPFSKRMTGLTSTRFNGKNQVDSRTTLFYLLNEVQDQKIGVVGITATQARAISDPHLKPRRCVVLDCDPIPGFCYFGKFHRGTLENFYQNQEKYRKQGYIPIHQGDDEISIARQILEIPHKIYKDRKMVRVCLVTTKFENIEHNQIATDLTNAFPNSLVKIVNQENQGLIEVFQELALNKSPDILHKLTVGGLFLVGLKCFEASVSVRPPPGMEITFNHDGEEWELFTLTDQIYQTTKGSAEARSLETNIQAQRCFGQYPEELGPRFWVMGTDPENKQKQKRLIINQNDVNRDLVLRYDGTISSVGTYQAKYVPFELFNGDPYSLPSGSRPTYQIEIGTKKPTGLLGPLHYHESLLVPIGEYLRVQSITDIGGKDKLSDFFKDIGNQNQLKNIVRAACEQNGVVLPLHTQFFYDQKRYDKLIRSTVHPQDDTHTGKGNYQVAALVTGDAGPETRLTDLYLSIFTNPILYQDRELDHPDWNYYFQLTPSKYAIVYKQDSEVRKYTHQYQGDYPFSQDHFEVIKLIGMLFLKNLTEGNIRRCNHLFGDWCLKKFGSRSALEWKTFPYQDHFKQFSKQRLNLPEIIAQMERIFTPLTIPTPTTILNSIIIEGANHPIQHQCQCLPNMICDCRSTSRATNPYESSSERSRYACDMIMEQLDRPLSVNIPMNDLIIG